MRHISSITVNGREAHASVKHERTVSRQDVALTQNVLRTLASHASSHETASASSSIDLRGEMRPTCIHAYAARRSGCSTSCRRAQTIEAQSASDTPQTQQAHAFCRVVPLQALRSRYTRRPLTGFL
ncbi:unnamed protein product [Rangifer tarandus platyrhynchus]|uniref:Uncharacterized protein n=1 Tax=Rangifer tarandus platyrhynchus TaxID=3082113 RepID=A0ABN8XLM8_RANTA|nr:unnamed protein product [Rangifer tarandus platyrhynchus]